MTKWTKDNPRSFAGVAWDQIIRDEKGQPICSVFVAGWSKKQAEAHADLIIAAVNKNAELIKALEFVRDRTSKNPAFPFDCMSAINKALK